MKGEQKSPLNFYFYFLQILLFLDSSFVRTNQVQQITFYADKDCSGISETFHDSKVIKDSWIHGAKSVKISGLWVYQILFANEKGKHSTSSYFLADDDCDYRWKIYWKEYGKEATSSVYSIQLKDDPLCKDKPSFMTHNTGEFLKFTRYGPSMVNSPRVIFFTEKNLEGAAYTFTGSNDTFSTCNVSVKSMAQFSNGTWIAYPEKFYRGEGICICSVYDWWRWRSCEKKDIPKNGFLHFNFEKEQKLGSIKLVESHDCSCKSCRRSQSLVLMIFMSFAVFYLCS